MTTHESLSVSEAERLGVAELLRRAETGDVVIERGGHAVAAVMSMARLKQIETAAADLTESARMLARLARDAGIPVSLDELFAEFGLGRAELQAEVDAEEASAQVIAPDRPPAP